MRHSNQLITAYVLAVFALSGLLPGVANPQAGALYSKKRVARECREAFVGSHRGELGRYAGSNHDENTLHAFKGAVNSGANLIETDLRLTKDGVWVLMHDPSVKRTTKGTGKVSSKTLAQIKTLRTDNGYRVPTLEKVLKSFASQPKVHFQLEIKQKNPSNAELQSLIDLIYKYNMASRVIFTSFNGEVLVKTKNLDSTLQTAYIAATGTKPSITTAQQYQVNQVMLDHTDLREKYVDKMNQNGIKVGVRGATTGAQYNDIIAKGSKHLVLDDVSGYTKWCRGL